ncbi:MAG: VTT domain-containing protein [Thermoanaerobaculia bacterium]
MLDFIQDVFRTLYNVEAVIAWGGLFVVCAFIYMETGLFFGFFLPGDSLLVTAGIFASQGKLNLALLLILGTICAFAGDQTGYWIGKKAGQALYRREDSLFFKKRHLMKAHDFYEKYGPITIVLARFVPVVRTFAPAVAGAAEMNYKKFVFYNFFGGLLWIFSMSFVGFFLGKIIPNVSTHIHLIIAIVIFISLLPAIIEFLKEKYFSKR